MLHASVVLLGYQTSSCLGSSSTEPQLFLTLEFPAPCPFILGRLPGVFESFWPVSQLSDKPASVPQPKGLVAYRSMPWPPESLEGRKGSGQSTLPQPGSAPPVPNAGRLGPPLLHTQPPKDSGQSTEGPHRPSLRGLQAQAYGPELICKDRLLAIQGGNQKTPVMGPPSWLDSCLGQDGSSHPCRGLFLQTPHLSLSGSSGENPAFSPGAVGSAFYPLDSLELS